MVETKGPTARAAVHKAKNLAIAGVGENEAPLTSRPPRPPARVSTYRFSFRSSLPPATRAKRRAPEGGGEVESAHGSGTRAAVRARGVVGLGTAAGGITGMVVVGFGTAVGRTAETGIEIGRGGSESGRGRENGQAGTRDGEEAVE